MNTQMGFWIISGILLISLMILFRYAVSYLSQSKIAGFFAWLILLVDVAAFSGFTKTGREYIHQYLSEAQIGLIIEAFTVLVMFQILMSVLVMIDMAIDKCKEKLKMPVDESKRRFLRKGVLMPIAVAGAAAYGNRYEKEHTVVREIAVPTKDLPENLYGFRIAQLSDVHLGMFFSLERLRDLMEQASSLKADVLVLTGDIFDDVDMNEEAAMIINEYTGRFPKGIFCCFGNHEHFRGIKKIKTYLAKTKIKLLDNRSVMIVNGERPLYLAGVDYPMARHAFDMLALSYMDDAFRNIPDKAVTVLLAHHPDFIDYAAERQVMLTLSGHTHGGQLGLFGIPLVPPVFKYMRGSYRVGDTFGYVHSGNGSWFPCRIGCPPEIACFSLCEEG